MDNKLFISDMDGTLLNDAGKLSEFSRKNLNRLIKRGLSFTVASARSVISIQKILKGLNIKLPVIEFNGAFLSNLKTGKHVIINEISEEIKYDILSDIEKYNHSPFISSFNGNEDLLYYIDTPNEGCRWYVNNRKVERDMRLTEIDSFKRVMDEHIVCFTIIDKKENLKGLESILKEKYGEEIELHLIENPYSKGWYWLTVHDWKSTKDRAIKELVKVTGHKLDDLVVFGDNINDIKMFRVASQSIALGNAKSELKEYADKIIDSNNENGVVKYIINEYG